MTETPDPAATFRLDQEAAEAETKTREEQTWEHQVRLGQVNLEQIQANAWALSTLAGRRMAEAEAITRLSIWAIPMMVAAAVRILRRRKP